MVIFWMLSTCAPTGIISILIKKKCSWPEALRFMEWKFIHVGRLCMPLRFTSTGWFPVWQQLGQGPKMMPKHSRFISHWMVFLKKTTFLSIECPQKIDCSLVNVGNYTPRFTNWSESCGFFDHISSSRQWYWPASLECPFFLYKLLHYISCKVQFIVKFICFKRAWLMNWTWLCSCILWFGLRQLCQVCKEAWQCLK